MDKLRELVEPLFHALIRVQREPVAGYAAEHIRADVCAQFEACARRAAEAGVSSADTDDARFALAVAIDELAVAREGALREHWLSRPLQTQYFNTNLGGSEFFDRLATLRQNPARRPVLTVYYSCLALGFRGKLGMRGGEVELLDLTNAVRAELVEAKEIPDEILLSPHGARPHEPLADARHNQLLVAIALSGAGFAMLTYIVLRLVLVHCADAFVEQLTRLSSG